MQVFIVVNRFYINLECSDNLGIIKGKVHPTTDREGIEKK